MVKHPSLVKHPYPPDRLRVPFKGKLDAENRAHLERHDPASPGDMTQRLEDALGRFFECPEAFTVDLPKRTGAKEVVNARVDPIHAARVVELVAKGRFPDRVSAVNYIVSHDRACARCGKKAKKAVAR